MNCIVPSLPAILQSCNPAILQFSMSDSRIVTAARVDEDAQYEAGLRPRVLDDYIGQDRVRENLQVSIAAARQRDEALDHVLLYGPPGSARRRWPTSSGTSSACRCGRPPDRSSKGPGISRQS